MAGGILRGIRVFNNNVHRVVPLPLLFVVFLVGAVGTDAIVAFKVCPILSTMPSMCAMSINTATYENIPHRPKRARPVFRPVQTKV